MISNAQVFGGLALAAIPFVALVLFDLGDPDVAPGDYAGCAAELFRGLAWAVAMLAIAAVCFLGMAYLWELW